MPNFLLRRTLVIFATVFAIVVLISCSGSTSTEFARFSGNLVGLPDLDGDQESRVTVVEVVHPDTAEVLSVELLDGSTTYEVSAPAGFGMVVAWVGDLSSEAFYFGSSDAADLAAGESRSVDIVMASEESVAGVSDSNLLRSLERAWSVLGGGIAHAQEVDRRPVIEVRGFGDPSQQDIQWRGVVTDELMRSGKFRIVLPPGVRRFIEREKERQRLGVNRPQDRMEFREPLVPDFIVQGNVKTEFRPRFIDRDVSYGATQTNTIDIEIIDARTGEVVARTNYSSEGPIRINVDQFGGNFGGRTFFPLAVDIVDKLLALPEAETFVTKPAAIPDEFYADSVMPMPRAKSLMGGFGEFDYFNMNLYRIGEASYARWRPTDSSRDTAEPDLAQYRGFKADFRLTSNVEEDGDVTVIVDYALQPSVESAEANLILAAVESARTVPNLYRFDEAYEIESFEGDQVQEAVIWGRVGRMVIRVLGTRILSCMSGCNSGAGLDMAQDAAFQGAAFAREALADIRFVRDGARVDRPSTVGEINPRWHLTRTGSPVEKGLRNQADFEADLRNSSESLPGPPGQPSFGTLPGTYDDPPELPELPELPSVR